MGTKKQKRKKRISLKNKVDANSVRNGLVIGVFLGMFVISFAGYFVYVGTIEIKSLNLLKDNLQVRAYERVAERWDENDFIKSLSYICSFKETETEKIGCLNFYVKNNFFYDDNASDDGYLRRKTDLVRQPEEIAEDGYQCMEIGIFYASLLKRLGISYDYVQLPTHVYLKVYPDNYECELDGDKFWCKENV